MNVLIDSAEGDGLGLALRLQEEGHAVALSIAEDKSHRVGDGLVAKVDDPVHAARKNADFVIFDMVGRGGIADALVDDDVCVIGAGRFQDKLELDRLSAMMIFEAVGLLVPPYEAFPDGDLDRAIRFVERADRKMVFKPCGNLGTDKTFLAEDAEEMVEYLDHLTRSGEKIGPFLLQDFVKGAEVSTERWYAAGEPIPGLDNCTLEEKKFLAGNLGPAVGCAGNVVFPGDPRLVRMTVGKLDRLCAEHDVCGPVDLNAIVDHGRAYILEATPRFGYDALQAFLGMWRMPLGETLYEIAEGDVPDVSLHPGVAAAVRVSVPPYPAGDAAIAKGCPIVDDILDDPAIWPCDVMLDDDRLVITGSDASAYVVTGKGPTLRDAYGACFKKLEKSRLPDRQWRNDLIEYATPRLEQLRTWGFFRTTGRQAA